MIDAQLINGSMPNSLGQKIRNLRKGKGLSLEKLAEMSDMSKSYMWELENRPSANPTTDKLAKISQALGVTADYLTNNSELTDEILKEAFFRKFDQLNINDKKKIEQIIELWSKKD